tara:strand:+ start:13 stop:1197 length:1185 start_codon:yes stop_codon:yes gene_type:complete
MSTLKVDNIRHNSATSDAITMASDGTCTANITNNLSNRRINVNGALNVAQRGTSFSSTSGGNFFADRYKVGFNTISAGTCVTSQQSLTSSDAPYALGFRKYGRLALGQAGTAAGTSFIEVLHKFEGQDINASGWDHTSSSSNFTVSFWFRCSTNQTFYVNLRSRDGTSYVYTYSFTASGNNTWTKITKTIPGNSNVQIDNDNGAGLDCRIWIFAGTDYTASVTLDQWRAYDTASRVPDMATTWLTAGASTIDFTGFQFEAGSVATDYEHRSVADELARCQRYFYMCADGTRGKSGTNRAPICTGAMYNSSNFNGVVNFPVEMRTTPSLYKIVGSGYFRIWGNGGSDGCNDVVLEGSSPQCGIANIYDGLSQTSGSATWATTDNAACRLGFQAEL